MKIIRADKDLFKKHGHNHIFLVTEPALTADVLTEFQSDQRNRDYYPHVSEVSGMLRIGPIPVLLSGDMETLAKRLTEAEERVEKKHGVNEEASEKCVQELRDRLGIPVE